MSETLHPFDSSEALSPEDMEVLRAFHATDTFAVFQGDHEGADGEGAIVQGERKDADPEGVVFQDDPKGREVRLYPTRLDAAFEPEDEMLVIFVSEVDEDIAALRRALEQAEVDERIDAPGLITLQRVAHKIRGTAAAIGCDAMSAIAHYIEMLVQHTKKGEIILLSGLFALGNAVGALEITLHSVVEQGQEDMQPLLNLEEYYAALDIHTQMSAGEDGSEQGAASRPSLDTGVEEMIFQGGGKPGGVNPRPYSVDRHHLGQLIQHAEQLVEQQTALEVARKQVETAIMELHAAQARLRRLEAFFATLPMSMQDVNRLYTEYDEHLSSSLVARILREAELRTGHIYQAKAKIVPQQPLLLAEAALWDEMEIDRFTESNLLTHALNEAIADVSTATAQLQHALAQLDTLLKQHMAKAHMVRANTLLLRTAPFSALSQRAQKAVQKAAWEREVQFEVTGETVEIDRDILETLETPLVQLINAHLVEAISNDAINRVPTLEGQRSPCQIRLHAHTVGSEVIIEIGFSLPIPGGFLDMLQEIIQPLHGSIAAQRNATGGLDFRLRFPHAKGVAQGLLIRAGEQRVIVPFSQVQRIDYAKQEAHERSYTLHTLLGFARTSPSKDAINRVPTSSSKDAINRVPTSPVLILQAGTQPVAVQVDEVVGQIELVMKPPAAPLRRPGITGMAIDSAGNVLLVLDVPELIRQSGLRQRFEEVPVLHHPERKRPKILIADDSVTIRNTLHQTLSQKDYIILEARDGSQALELLAEESPDLLLLDLEMPNMNGYEVLNILRTRAMLPQLKIILLTSRGSEKHKRRAHELGVHTYLTKPCSYDELMETVGSLLSSSFTI